MATQADVQTLIQSLTPSGVNNGNPNTAYNNPMPVMDAQGRWSTPQVNPAASITLNRPNLAALLPSTAQRQLTMPTLTPLVSNPVTSQPVVGGGGTGPSVTLPEPPVQIGGGQAPGTIGGLAQQPLPGTIGGDLFQELFRDPLRPGISPIMGGGVGSVGSLPSWQQLVDAGLDVAGLPGDFYLSGTGKWDLSNILEGLGTAATGLPISTGLDYLTKLYAGGDLQNLENAPAWLQDRYLDNLNNLLANTQATSINQTTAQLNKSIGQQLADRLASDLAKRGIDTGTGASQEAARKEAEAKQAREFVEGYTSMPANMQRSAAQSRQAIQRMFGGHER